MKLVRNRPKRALRRYVGRIRSLLSADGAERRRIGKRLQEQIDGELRDADCEVLTARFGAPETVAASFVEAQSTEELLCAMRRQRMVWRAVAAAILVAVLAVGTWTYSVFYAIRAGVGTATVVDVISYEYLSDEEVLRQIQEVNPDLKPPEGMSS